MSALLDRAYRALTIGIVALISLLAFEYLAVATAMPAVARELDGLSLYALAFGGPMATGVIGMVLSGRWSDRAGPAPALWCGVATFVAGLLLAGLATSMPQLVLGRLVQGLGGGMMTVALYVIVGRAYPPALHPRIFAAFAAAWVVPVIVGPPLAGLIVEHIGWRWVFLAAILLAVPAALLVRQGLQGRSMPTPPATAAPDPRRLLWALGAAASAGLLYYAGQQRGAGSLLLVVALAGLALFAPPLLPAGTLRARRGLPTVIALRGLAAAAFVGCEIFIPLMLSGERGLSLTQAGLVLTVGALGWSAGSWFQARPQRRRGVPLLQTGMALIATGIAGVALTLLPSLPLLIGIVGWTLAGFGMGLVYPSLSVLTLELSPPAEQGVNSSALQLSDSLFSAIVLAVVGALFTALLPWSAPLAYLAGMTVAISFALLGVAVAARTLAPA